jgi:pyruvate dehydrogenase E1 component
MLPAMSVTRTDAPPLAELDEIQRRVLWLATRMIDFANRERPSDDGLKVGGHQASSASLVTVMTALYFHWLRGGDRVSVKPHASPVLHAVNYLLGRLDRSQLGRLRDFGGLQAYPSRTKDPDPIDFSTGSVGLGAAAPLFAGVVDRYVRAHFGTREDRRFVALIGDAELDEGNVWEAIADPSCRDVGNVTWIVDFNRQSLDRVIPGVRSGEFTNVFREHGWHVEILKYGPKLRAAYELPGGDTLRRRIDDMPNPEYQSLLRRPAGQLRALMVDGASRGDRGALERVLSNYSDEALPDLIGNLAGHDLGDVLEALDRCDAERQRPSVIFAFTVKGFGLPIAGHPMNHSAVLTGEQIDALRLALADPADEWAGFDRATPAGAVCAAAARRLTEPEGRPRVTLDAAAIPTEFGPTPQRDTTSQEAFARALVDLSRYDDVAKHLVTTSPDVSISTGLGGWINKRGVFAPTTEVVYESDEASPLRWTPGPDGQHIELGISEMNLFLLLGQLGLAAELHDTQLLPVGTVYDPFVCRGLDALIYGTYSGSKFVFAGTPSGVSLSREGGAHQSAITPSIGAELPGLRFYEPCFALETEWILLDAIRGVCDREYGESAYLRLSTTPVSQQPFADLLARQERDHVRAGVLSGAYRLAEAPAGLDRWRCVIASCGALLPEALRARDLLAEEGIGAAVINVTSSDLVFRRFRARTLPAIVRPEEVGRPLITAHDAAPQHLAFLAAALGMALVPLGVDRFGQCGSQPAVYGWLGISGEAIAESAIGAFAR